MDVIKMDLSEVGYDGWTGFIWLRIETTVKSCEKVINIGILWDAILSSLQEDLFTTSLMHETDFRLRCPWSWYRPTANLLLNPTSEQDSFYKNVRSVILPSNICWSWSPSRCHGDDSCEGLWLAYSVCPFSGFVARGRASLSLPWVGNAQPWLSKWPGLAAIIRFYWPRRKKKLNKISSSFLAAFVERRKSSGLPTLTIHTLPDSDERIYVIN